MAVRTNKNPLEQALGQFATPELRDECLRVCHAAMSTAMVISLTSNHSTEKKGALGEAYAETLKQIESMMGSAISPYAPPTKTTVFTHRSAIPKSSNNQH